MRLTFQFLSILVVGLTVAAIPARGGAFNVLSCDAVPSGPTWTGQASTCSANPAANNGGSATIEGYAHGGLFFFSTSLTITASNFVPFVFDPFPDDEDAPWWNPLAEAGWSDRITFYGPLMDTPGSLELTYTVSGELAATSNFYNNGLSSWPMRGILFVQGPPVPDGAPRQDHYAYINAINYTNAPRSFTYVIPFTFGKAQSFGAWIRSEVLLQDPTAVMNGVAYSDFSHTVGLSQVRVLDDTGADITGSVNTGATDFFNLQGGNQVPEPSAFLLVAGGLAVTLLRRARGRISS